jgi:hypothetical protein
VLPINDTINNLGTTMDGVSDYQLPQIPGPPQLGNFAKLPLELRLLIWEYLFCKIYTTPHVLSILRCSRYLYQEIADHLYRGMRHEIQIPFTDNSLKWLYVRLSSKNMSAKWRGLKNFKAVRGYLHNFPHTRIEEKEIFVNTILPSHKGRRQTNRLEQKVNRLVDILNAAPVAPTAVWIIY